MVSRQAAGKKVTKEPSTEQLAGEVMSGDSSSGIGRDKCNVESKSLFILYGTLTTTIPQNDRE